MKRVPVDKLLQWALNDELPKGHHVMEDVRRIIERASHAQRPGVSRRYIPANMLQTGSYLGGAPHKDALTIARVVQRFSVYIGLSSEASVRALLGPLADLEPQAITGRACGAARCCRAHDYVRRAQAPADCRARTSETAASLHRRRSAPHQSVAARS